MSDLFIGEILVLLLLVPVLLRPFSRRFQRIDGIPLLPLVAIILCTFIIAGSGFRISFFPVFLITALIFVFGLIRLARLFMGLPTDWYKPLSVAWNSFLLALFAGSVILAFSFAPESGYTVARTVGRSIVTERESAGLNARITVWNATSSTGSVLTGKPVMIMAGDLSAGSRGRNSAALEIAAAGYTVLSADFSGLREYKNPLMGNPLLRQFFAVGGEIVAGHPLLVDAEETVSTQENELALLVRYAHATYGTSAPLYVLAEGSSSEALFNYMRKYPRALDGAVAIVNTAENPTLPPLDGPSALPGGYAVLSGVDGMMPAAAASFPVLVITGDDRGRYGFGELASDDVLAARLLGSSRDSGKKTAVLTGRRIVAWLSDRRVHDRS